jgi:hypothetical protein
MAKEPLLCDRHRFLGIGDDGHALGDIDVTKSPFFPIIGVPASSPG